MTRKEMRQLLKERYYLASGKGNRDIRRIRIRDATIGTIFAFTPLLVLTIFVFAAFGIAIWLSFMLGNLIQLLKALNMLV